MVQKKSKVSERKIQINLGNKTFYSLVIIVAILITAGIVYAYNSDSSAIPNPAIMGHTIDEIEVVNDNGSTTSLEQYIADQTSSTGGISCPSSPSFTTNGVPSGWNSVSLPSDNSCKTDVGCVILQKIYYKGNLKLTRQYDFHQDASNKWWSSYKTAGSYTNGDSSHNSIVPNYNSDTIRIYDDVTGQDTGTANSISVGDTAINYYQDIFFCSGGNS